MSARTAIPEPDDITLNILANVMRAIGQPHWETRLTPDDRALVRACAGEAARLGLRTLASPRNRDLHLDLLRAKAAIHARLAASPALGGPGRLADAFWDGYRETIGHALAVAFAEM